MNNNIKKYTAVEQSEEYKAILDKFTEIVESSGLTVEELLTSQSINDDHDKLKHDKLKEDIKQIKQSAKIVNNGIYGQKIAKDSLSFHKDMIILENIQTPSDNHLYSQEHDIILICKSAIYTIEVKNINAQTVTINEAGHMYYSNHTIKQKNIGRQIKNHTSSLKELLKGTKYCDFPIIPVIIFINPQCTIKNNYTDKQGKHRIIDCHPNTIEDIFDNQLPDILEFDDIKNIEKLLIETNSMYPEKKYPLNIDVDSFFENVNSVVKSYKNDKKNSAIIRGILEAAFLIEALFKM